MLPLFLGQRATVLLGHFHTVWLQAATAFPHLSAPLLTGDVVQTSSLSDGVCSPHGPFLGMENHIC